MKKAKRKKSADEIIRNIEFRNRKNQIYFNSYRNVLKWFYKQRKYKLKYYFESFRKGKYLGLSPHFVDRLLNELNFKYMIISN